MNRIATRGITEWLCLQIILAVLLFLPAWSAHYWEAWVYWCIFSVMTLLITLYLPKYDPSLVERRLAVGSLAGTRTIRRFIHGLASALFCAVYVVAKLDHRFGWSAVPLPMIVGADALVASCFVGIFFICRQNSALTASVEFKIARPVISTGPYGLVRHPMYAGVVAMLSATPLALGSFWALLVALPLVAIILARLLDEEQYLQQSLPGYEDYCRTVRYRLLPFIW